MKNVKIAEANSKRNANLPSAHFQPPLVDICQNGVDDVDFFAQTFLFAAIVC